MPAIFAGKATHSAQVTAACKGSLIGRCCANVADLVYSHLKGLKEMQQAFGNSRKLLGPLLQRTSGKLQYAALLEMQHCFGCSDQRAEENVRRKPNLITPGFLSRRLVVACPPAVATLLHSSCASASPWPGLLARETNMERRACRGRDCRPPACSGTRLVVAVFSLHAQGPKATRTGRKKRRGK